MKKLHCSEAAKIAECLEQAVLEHVGKAMPGDDVTLLIVSRDGPPN